MCALKKWMDIDWISFLHRPDIHQDSQGYKFGNKNIKTKKIRYTKGDKLSIVVSSLFMSSWTWLR